jgi:TatD-related deoxyribonuclease
VRVTDNHAHANPVKGLGFVEVAKRFKEAGGVAIVFAPLLSWHYSVSVTSSESYSRVFEVVLRGRRERHLDRPSILGRQRVL